MDEHRQFLHEVGEHIRTLRKARGWNQKTLGQRVEMDGKPLSQAAISSIEKGAVDARLRTYHAIAQALGVSLNQLVTPANTPSENEQLRQKLEELLENHEKLTALLAAQDEQEEQS